MAPKHGNAPDECEDALYVRPDVAVDVLVDGPIVAAVCDGASESMLAGQWANILAAAALDHASASLDFFGASDEFRDFAAEVVFEWSLWVDDYVAQRVQQGRPLKWYEEAKLPQGAFATLLVVHVASESAADDSPYVWRAAALGDSCLFHVRDDKIIATFPVQDSADFGVTPDLFGSVNRNGRLLAERSRFLEGTCEAGDHLFMMTDALAAWFLRCRDLGDVRQAIHQLRELDKGNDLQPFLDWISTLRATGDLRNDDVSLIHIDIQG
nr:protein phosphatase 2C domain-containing protein [Actinopolymorpha pittospori]